MSRNNHTVKQESDEIGEEFEEVMEKRTDQFNSLSVEQLATQWRHKINSIPKSDGLTDRWWSFTGGVVRDGPEAKVPGGNSIYSKQTGDYTVGVPALAGGAVRVEGVPEGGDDWWSGYGNRLEGGDSDGAGIGLKYFNEGGGNKGGAIEDGVQEYVWFDSGVDGVDDLVIPRDKWSIKEDKLDVDKGEMFKVGGFLRIDHTLYNHGSVKINYGLKRDDGSIDIVTLYEINTKGSPMWDMTGLHWELKTVGNNLTGYVYGSHYKAGRITKILRGNGTGRDGSVFGASLSALTQGEIYPVISIKIRSNWNNTSIVPAEYSVEMNDGFYSVILLNPTLDTPNFKIPNNEINNINPSSSEYAVMVENEATSLSDAGRIEKIDYGGGETKGNSLSTVGGALPELALEKDDIVTIGVIPTAATELSGASFNWGGDF
jgi:hypothetical protein